MMRFAWSTSKQKIELQPIIVSNGKQICMLIKQCMFGVHGMWILISCATCMLTTADFFGSWMKPDNRTVELHCAEHREIYITWRGHPCQHGNLHFETCSDPFFTHRQQLLSTCCSSQPLATDCLAYLRPKKLARCSMRCVCLCSP